MMKFELIAVLLSALVFSVHSQDSCLRCTSSVADQGCLNPGINQFVSNCPQGNNRSCFSRINEDGHLVRGCRSQLDNSTASECDSETCQICTSNNCNSEVFPTHRLRCHICSGNEESDCAGSINRTASICPIFRNDDSCFVARTNDRNYVRGCLSSTTIRCDDDDSCLTCNGHGCNFVEFDTAVSTFSVVKVFAMLMTSLSILKVIN